jgi:hypothetical protein
MSKISRLLPVLVWPALALTSPALQAQEKSERVRITTVDSVELLANYYACSDAKVKNPPVIIMLHPIGESSQKKPWVALAEALQKKFSVVTFDFRGHGNSTEVVPETFWKFPANRSNNSKAVGAAAATKNTIDIKEFNKGYYPVLVNDIAAVKAFLDRKNDTGACNTSSCILLGADTGATLGAIWLNAEWHRFRLVQNPVTLASQPDARSEGQDYIGCVWLSMTPTLGSSSVNLQGVLDLPMRQKAVPMVFLHGNEDSKGKATAAGLMRFKTARDKAKYPLTDRIEVKAGKLSGMELLQKSLKQDEEILGYLTEVVDQKGREWTEREFRKTAYAWRVPLNSLNYINAHVPNDTNLVFDSYTKFMR